ncbi:hypothetical protein JCM9140_1609 [Halalkalibacter wakoensis JCM 9140]|uniref:DinB-like domain-containing protein n=1 Tax=Halalkalibacter wakoensis JCM 9140 TaxID=1236970 RepID=W4Q1K3_9BACI|nr:DinB family protein [Halalkalibacter wakoensis]GAE25603.1 hypothetical protein JCM9140_1609 [Halalkalibacter wakoensis JCM 9140]
MNFTMEEAIEVLERTPEMLVSFLSELSYGWLTCNEGDGTWNASEVIDHLIEGEKNNWIPRLEIILEEGEAVPFPPFNRYAHINEQNTLPIKEKLLQFQSIRMKNLAKLKTLMDSYAHLELTGTHPAFGKVKARELISTWVVHDLTHVAQITRVMAERYRDDVGPWKEYLGVLKQVNK